MRRASETLSERRLSTLRAQGERPRDVHDAAVPGLIFRARPTGWRGFVLRYTAPSGRRRLLVLGEHGSRPPALSLAAARERAGEVLLELRSGADPLETRSAARGAARAKADAERDAARAEEARRRALAAGQPVPGTFAHLAHSYVRDHARKRKRTWREDERKIARELVPAWGERPAGEITRGDVRSLVFGIAEGEGARARPGRPAPTAANRTLALVSRIYSYAVDAEYPGVTGNPAYRLARPAPERSRDRVLSEPEIRALWTATEAEALLPRVALRLLLLTGLRRGELLGARWRDLSEDELGLWLEVPADRSKSGRPLRAPLSTAAREVLRELSEVRDSEFLFPGQRAGRSLYDLNGPTRRARDLGLLSELKLTAEAAGASDDAANKEAQSAIDALGEFRQEAATIQREHPTWGAVRVAGEFVSRRAASGDPRAAAIARLPESRIAELLRPWTIHDLRRTFRTMLAALRVPPGIAERCLGHVAPDARGVAGVYDRHSYAEERLAAVEALARRVREIVSGERANVLPFYQRAAVEAPAT